MKASSTTQLTIGQLAQRFGLATHVLRHWESEGLLAPARDASGYRRYDTSDAVRVATIVHQRGLGIPLPVIRMLLDGDAADRHEVLAGHRGLLESQMTALRLALDMTDHALGCTAHDVAECPTFQDYVADVMRGAPAAPSLESRLAARPR